MLDIKRNFVSFYVLSIFFIVYAFYQAFSLRWICDDAYISFVYAKNFWEGHGLVFNLEERVEGYTNFLWTIYLSFGYLLGILPQTLSVYTGLFFYIILLCLFFYEENKRTLGNFYPLYLVHLSMFYHLFVFASSGLETSIFTFFVSFGFLLWEKRNQSAFISFLLASLIRPEGALFLFFICLDWIRTKRFRIPILYGFLFLSFLVFRYLYYQDFFPNTFYAKGNKGSYLSQGIYYFLYLIRSYPLYLFVILLSGIQIYRSYANEKENRILLLTLLLYILYVLYVGGDFMGNRFWIPILPYVSFLAFKQLQVWSLESQIGSNQQKFVYRFYSKNAILFSLIFILSSAIYMDPLKSTEGRIADWHGIVEERVFYENHLMDVSGYDTGALEGLRVAFFGAQAHFIYYLNPSFAFEAESGLTDKTFARKPILVRGRIGHEAKLTYEDLTSRNIDLVLDNRFPELELPFITYTWRKIPIRFYIWNYEPLKLNRLCERKDWNCEELKIRFQKENLDLNSEKFFGKTRSL
ncbi:hypothetical protein EHQ46_08590 [Leptospira yanagawae]|uniref:DUF2079 domain-containing protein n=1 Tax=Leptospira yanagawae TaxID=293069 RepID=A0ABY2M2D4_9LEPT|nr:hypothetical protein [Leptospira yanagawae]TGL21891.1 hypothetical protein EHQ46_08590 [Leptospira yanagawae]